MVRGRREEDASLFQHNCHNVPLLLCVLRFFLLIHYLFHLIIYTTHSKQNSTHYTNTGHNNCLSNTPAYTDNIIDTSTTVLQHYHHHDGLYDHEDGSGLAI